ncbi:MAG: hypothetical protein C0417_13530 [Chlorobiaceae bacterium]|nr:hypothetical protein [Chlorobiaceae bacterium]
MNTLKILLISFLPILFFIGCNENASNIGFEDPTDPSVAPRVVWVWLDSQRPYYRIWDKLQKLSDSLPIGYTPGRLLIRFNKIMLSYTVIPNVTLLPKDDGFAQLSTYGAISIDGQTFEFPIYGYFKVGQSYTVTVGKEATDVTYRKLESDNQKNLLPEPVVRMINSYPANNDTSVYLSSSLSGTFNSPIDSNSLPTNVTITPYVDGKWSTDYYSSRNHIVFIPKSGFKGNTWYEISFSTGVKDTFNNHLASPITLRFKTAPFKITNTYPWNGQQNVYQWENISASFSNYIDTSSVRSAFSISPQVEGMFTYYNMQFYFDPYQSLLANTTYTVTIRSSIRSITGDTLATPHTFSFKTSN